MAPNSKTLRTITPKIKPNPPLVVMNLLVKFYKDPLTKTKVIIRKLNVSSDDDEDADSMIALYDANILLRSYKRKRQTDK